MKHSILLIILAATTLLLNACLQGGKSEENGQSLASQQPATEAPQQPVPATSGSKRVLHVGDAFGSPEQFLQLFGLKPKPQTDVQPVPRLKGVVVWTPDFGSTEWHYVTSNPMGTPTIQESWNPDPAAQQKKQVTPEYIELLNKEHYYEMLFRNFVCITFAKGYQGHPGYTYLGIYVVNRDASSIEHMTYDQAQTDCPLTDLAPLMTLAPVATPIQ